MFWSPVTVSLIVNNMLVMNLFYLSVYLYEFLKNTLQMKSRPIVLLSKIDMFINLLYDFGDPRCNLEKKRERKTSK